MFMQQQRAWREVYSPGVSGVGQLPVHRDEVADVLVEGVLLPAVVHELLYFGREVGGQHDGFAHVSRGVGHGPRGGWNYAIGLVPALVVVVAAVGRVLPLLSNLLLRSAGKHVNCQRAMKIITTL